MGLKDQLTADMKEAMKAKEPARLSVIRMLMSELKYAQAAVNIHQELPEEEVTRVISGYHKRLQKSLEEFPEGERRDTIRKEMAVVEAYLPKRADAGDIAKAIDDALAATADRSFGPLMKDVLVRLGGAADGKQVSQLLKDRIAGK